MARTKKTEEVNAENLSEVENMSELEKLKSTIAYHERCIDKAKAKIAELENKEKSKQIKSILEGMSAEEIASKLGISIT